MTELDARRLEVGIDCGIGRSSGPRESSMGVFTGPGHSTLTRTPFAAASDRSASDRPTTANFVVE